MTGCIPVLMIEQIDYELWAGNLPASPPLIPVRNPGDGIDTPDEFEEDEEIREPADPPPPARSAT